MHTSGALRKLQIQPVRRKRRPTESKLMNDQLNRNQDEALLTKRQLSPKLQKSPRTIDNWMKDGRLPFLKVGRTVLFSWPDVLASLKERYGVDC